MRRYVHAPISKHEDLAPWMLKEAERHIARLRRKPIRDVLVEACVNHFKCRYQDAREAHQLLPDHLRRVPGEHD